MHLKGFTLTELKLHTYKNLLQFDLKYMMLIRTYRNLI